MFPTNFTCYRCGQALTRDQVRFDSFAAGRRVLPRCSGRSGGCQDQARAASGALQRAAAAPVFGHRLVENN